MANVKRITITGKVAFNCHENDFLKSTLAFMNGPTSGLHISWTGTAGSVPNEYGGKTVLYQFRVDGKGAVSNGWIETFCNSVVAMDGKIYECKVFDVENGEDIDFSQYHNFPIHK